MVQQDGGGLYISGSSVVTMFSCAINENIADNVRVVLIVVVASTPFVDLIYSCASLFFLLPLFRKLMSCFLFSPEQLSFLMKRRRFFIVSSL